MSIICVARGHATMGRRTTDKDGNVISQTPAKFETDPAGPCVAVWTENDDTREPEAPASLFGDWQASGYLAGVLELVKPDRKIDVPDLGAIVRAAKADGFDVCDYCQEYGCRDCIVNDWKEGGEDE